MELSLAEHYRDSLKAHFERVRSPGTEVVLHGCPNGWWKGQSPTSVIASPYVYHRKMAELFLQQAILAEKEGADAFIIGTFSEPVLAELRSAVDILVVSPPEATILVACTAALKIGLVAHNSINEMYLERIIERHHFRGRISGIYVIEGDHSEAMVNSYFSDAQAYVKQFEAAARRAVADHADAIIPTEGHVAEILVANGITQVDGVSVVDAIGLPVMFAEFLVNLRRKTGLAQGRRWAYPLPNNLARTILTAP
jgi:Asp/Glu/hydantoin racemase